MLIIGDVIPSYKTSLYRHSFNKISVEAQGRSYIMDGIWLTSLEKTPTLENEDKTRSSSIKLKKKKLSVKKVADINGNIRNDNEIPFENLVMEGGGNKGLAYVGALRELENAGILPNIKRICGTSAGAIVASLIAIGYSSAQLREFLQKDLKKVFEDHKFGLFSFIPNLISGFGWNPGKKFLEYFGNYLKEATGNSDITFKEVHEKYGRELCIVVTNLSRMSTEYCHVKTTPNMPIKIAIRMSIAIPGFYKCVWYKANESVKDKGDVYVDGGLLCNYPIHAFDGWWLSMERENSFFRRLQPLEDCFRLYSKNERFGSWNDKTIGFMLYSSTETEILKHKLESRNEDDIVHPPKNSKLYQRRISQKKYQSKATTEHKLFIQALQKLIKMFLDREYDYDNVIDLEELEDVLNHEEFLVEDRKVLFCEHTAREIFTILDKNGDGLVTFQELLLFAEQRGVGIQDRFVGYGKKEISSLREFAETLQTALSINLKRIYVEEKDIERTIGIDTQYIETTDFELEKADKEFLIEAGARAARVFLRHHGCKRSNAKQFNENNRF